MSALYAIRPISDRTPFTGKHRRSPFDSPWSRTERLLVDEVRHLRGRDLVIECDVSERDIRLDGRLYARANPDTPAVRVAFDSVHGPLVYATDRFSTWQDNVRAIALGLESLRRVDRYGITRHGEQYTGWKAIEATPSGMGRDVARNVLVAAAGVKGSPPDDWKALYRKARGAAHPDRHHGDRVMWDQVEAAGRALGLDQ